MIDDEFSLVLPSDASQEAYRDNHQGDFTVDLPETVELHGQWDVAVTSLQYTHDWRNLARKQTFGVFLYNFVVRDNVDQEVRSAQPRAAQVEDYAHWAWTRENWALQYRNNLRYERVVVQAGYYPTLESLGEAFVTAANEVFARNRGSAPPVRITFEYNVNMRTVCFKAEHQSSAGMWNILRLIIVVLDSTTSIMPLMGFKDTNVATIPQAQRNKYPYYAYYGSVYSGSIVDLTDEEQENVCIVSSQFEEQFKPGVPPFRSLFLYCDLVRPMIVGNSKVQLLGTSSISTKQGEVGDLFANRPMHLYTRVNTSSFQRVTLRLADTSGATVQFLNFFNPVIATLHFRRHR